MGEQRESSPTRLPCNVCIPSNSFPFPTQHSGSRIRETDSLMSRSSTLRDGVACAQLSQINHNLNFFLGNRYVWSRAHSTLTVVMHYYSEMFLIFLFQENGVQELHHFAWHSKARAFLASVSLTSEKVMVKHPAGKPPFTVALHGPFQNIGIP